MYGQVGERDRDSRGTTVARKNNSYTAVLQPMLESVLLTWHRFKLL